MASEEMEKCSICLEDANPNDPTKLAILLQGCGHAQHYQCLSRWARESNKCPVCRETISPEDRDLLDVDPVPEVGPEEQFFGFQEGIYEPAIVRRLPPPPPPRLEVVQIHIPEEVLMQMPVLDMDGTEWVENLTSLLEQMVQEHPRPQVRERPQQVQERPQQVQERPRPQQVQERPRPQQVQERFRLQRVQERPRPRHRHRGPNDIPYCHFHWNMVRNDGTVRGRCRHGFIGRGCRYRH